MPLQGHPLAPSAHSASEADLQAKLLGPTAFPHNFLPCKERCGVTWVNPDVRMGLTSRFLREGHSSGSKLFL